MSNVYDIFNQFATDPKKELEGVWHRIGGSDEKPVRILVARNGNKRHSRIVTQLWDANKTTLDLKNDAADAKGEEITVEAMSKGILMGWENVVFKGEVIKDGWTVEDAKKLLAVKDFRDMVSRLSTEQQKYKIVQDEADAKN